MPKPKPLADAKTAYWRVIAMARARKIDLVAAFASDRLTDDAWAGMVQRCRGCGWSQGCDHWLARAGGQAPLHAVPVACRNHAQLAALQDS